jgi:hypothetical protein
MALFVVRRVAPEGPAAGAESGSAIGSQVAIGLCRALFVAAVSTTAYLTGYLLPPFPSVSP